MGTFLGLVFLALMIIGLVNLVGDCTDQLDDEDIFWLCVEEDEIMQRRRR